MTKFSVGDYVRIGDCFYGTIIEIRKNCAVVRMHTGECLTFKLDELRHAS